MADSEELEKFQSQLEQINDALEEGDVIAVKTTFEDMHYADVAQTLSSLPNDIREDAWPLISDEIYAEVLAEVDDGVRTQHLKNIDAKKLAEIASEVDPDDATDILQDLPESRVEEVLDAMDSAARMHLEALLPYAEDTAGGLMNTDVIRVRPDMKLETVSRYLRRLSEIPDKTNLIMVVDRENMLVGNFRLVLLFTNDPESLVEDIMNSDVASICADTPAADVAKTFAQRDLVSAPVVNEKGALIGRITIDDVVDVIREEGERPLLHMAGLSEESDTFERMSTSVFKRTPWLAINLATALLAAWVIGLFETALQNVVALAILMPVVASMGGIAGSQTMTVVIRGMALGHIGRSNSKWILGKELMVGFINGLIWSVVLGFIAAYWFENRMLGIIMGIAIALNLVVAGIAGGSLPLILKKLNIDPALAGGVVLTTVTDVIGFSVFLGLGTLFLLHQT